MYNRISIVGGSGTGKSTLCDILAKKLNLPAIHLDAINFEANWVEIDKNKRDKIINERKEELPIESEHCSIREQDAQNCERDVDKMKKAEYMADHIGEIYEGIISGVQEFGIFVELENTVEGLIKAENIKGDYYVYDSDMMALIGKKTKKKYAFGDKITIRVVRADKDKSEIDFEVYDEKEKQINNKKKQK